MTTIDLPYLHLFHARGRPYSYYRRGGRRVPIAGEGGERLDVGTAAWLQAYQRIHDQFEAAPAAAGTRRGSLGELVARFKQAPEFLDKAAKTRRDYQQHLDYLAENFGDLPVATLPREFVLELRDKFRATPRMANYRVAVLRLLLTFAVDRGYRPDNPALRPRLLRTGPGWRAWSADDVARFRKVAPAELQLALLLALGTGQRQADLLRMAWSQYDGAAIAVRQEKTGARVWIPAHRELRRQLDRTRRRATVILTTSAGEAWRADHFRHEFAKAVRAAGLGPTLDQDGSQLAPGLVFHGLRKTAAEWLAEAGCTVPEIQAITGHRTLAMVAHYAKGADQKRLAAAAIAKLDGHARAARLANKADRIGKRRKAGSRRPKKS